MNVNGFGRAEASSQLVESFELRGKARPGLSQLHHRSYIDYREHCPIDEKTAHEDATLDLVEPTECEPRVEVGKERGCGDRVKSSSVETDHSVQPSQPGVKHSQP